MKALILGALLLSVASLLAVADDPPQSHRNTPNEEAFTRAAPPPNGPAGVPSMSGWNIDVVDAIAGTPGPVEFVDDLVYAGGYGALTVLDIADQAAPTRVGFTLIAGSCRRIVRNGNYLYCTTQIYPDNYLQIVDISTPTEPVVVQTLLIIGDAIAVDDGFLYLEHGEGVRVYELMDPTNPVLRGFCASRFVMEIAARDGLVYVARGSVTGKGIQIIDANDPSNPTTLSILPVGGEPNGTGPWSMDLEGNYIYALTFATPNALYIVDISNPNAPAIVSSIPGGWLVDVDAQGDYVYVSDDDGYVRVFDVTNPASPVTLPPLYRPCGSYSAGTLEVAGDIAAVSAGGLCFLDLSTPSSPVSITSYKGFSGGYSLDVAGSHLAVSQGNGWLAILNRFDPSLRYSAPGTGWYVDGTQVAVKGDYAYVSMCDSWYSDFGDDGLEVFDLSDPTSPTRVGLLPTSWCAREMSIGDAYLYLATHGEVWVVDVTNPAAPTKVGELQLWIEDLFADEPFVYLTDEGGFHTLDVSNPALPTIVASLPLPGLPHGIWVSESYAYVAAGQSLLVIDISNPLSPSIATSHPTTQASNVRIRDRYAYVSDHDYLRIFDVSDPLNPTEQGNIETNGLWTRVAVAPPFIYAITEGPIVVFETPLITDVPRQARAALSLKQNYPNPFNPSTTIAFDTPSHGRVRLDIFDVRGRLVRRLVDESMPAGAHSTTWDGRNDAGITAGSGVYFYRLEANGKAEAKKMVILK